MSWFVSAKSLSKFLLTIIIDACMTVEVLLRYCQLIVALVLGVVAAAVVAAVAIVAVVVVVAVSRHGKGRLWPELVQASSSSSRSGSDSSNNSSSSN